MDLKIEDCVTPIAKSNPDNAYSIQNYLKDNINKLEYQYYYNFYLTEIPFELLEQEEVLWKIHQKFPIMHIGLSKFHPWTIAKWHKDARRGLAINMLLQHERSHVLFANIKDYESFGEHGITNFIEHNYELDTFYLFNTQIDHSIYNFEGERYLFTLEFEQDKTELNYYDVLEYYESL